MAHWDADEGFQSIRERLVQKEDTFTASPPLAKYQPTKDEANKARTRPGQSSAWLNRIPANITHNAWTLDDPAVRQLFYAGRINFVQTQRRPLSDREDVKRETPSSRGSRSPTLPPISSHTMSRRESLNFFSKKSLESKEKSMMRYPRLGSVVGQRPAKRSIASQDASSPPQPKDGADLQAQFAVFVSRTVSQLLSLPPDAESTDESSSLKRVLIETITESVVQDFTSFEDYATDPRPVIEAVRAKMADDDLAEVIRTNGLAVTAGDPQSERFQTALTDYQKAADEVRESRSKERPVTPGAVETVAEERSSVELLAAAAASVGATSVEAVVQLGLESPVVASSPEGPEPWTRMSHRKMILSGSLVDLPELQKRIVRVYLCSSYSDMKDERAFLMRFASGKLQSMAGQLNLEFQMVDLKWGITDDMANDPQNLPVFIEQIHQCQAQSVGPVFMVLIGDRYGNQDLPTSIPVDLFRKIVASVQNLHIGNPEIINDWYKLDENAVPPVYSLQPISSKIKNFGLMEYGAYSDQMRKTAARQWLMVEQSIRDSIEKALLVAQDTGTVTAEEADEYSVSVFDKEIREGMTSSSTATSYCAYYERRIDSIEYSVNEEMAPRYIDIINRNEQRAIDRGKQRRLEQLKANMAGARSGFVCQQVRSYETELWDNANELEVKAATTNKRRSMVKEGDESAESGQMFMLYEDLTYIEKFNYDWDEAMESNIQTAEEKAFMTAENEVYLYKVVRDFVTDCNEMMQHYLAKSTKTKKQVDQLQEEVIQQARICLRKVGRCSETRYDLEAMEGLVRAAMTGDRPLLVSGERGSGVSTYTAQIAYRLKDWFGPGTAVIMRFIGLTPASLTVESVLDTVQSQIAELYGFRFQKPSHVPDLLAHFGVFLDVAAGQVSADRRLFIVLDGLDKLSRDGDAHSLFWLPRTFPPFVHLVLSTSTENRQILLNARALYGRMMTVLEPEPWSVEEALIFVRTTLAKRGRTLTDRQRNLVLSRIEGNMNSPLLATLLVKEASLWSSSSTVALDDLPSSVEEAVLKLFNGLELQLGSTFVRNAISYITVSANGLTELEWEDALACDDDVLDEVFQFVEPTVHAVRCPQLFIARLRFHLGELLIQVDDHGVPVFFWHDRFIADVISKNYLTNSGGHNDAFYRCNRILSDLFYHNGSIEKTLNLRKRQLVLERANRMVAHRLLVPQNHRKLTMLPKFLHASGPEAEIREELKAKILCSIPWLMTKIHGRSLSEVLLDFAMVEEKDNDILVVEKILRDGMGLYADHPELLQLEILARFSAKIQSDCLRRMVIASKSLLVNAKSVLLYPIYPGLPESDRCLQWSRRGHTHLLGVHDEKFAVLWEESNGLEIVQLTPTPRSLFPLRERVPRENVLLSDDRYLLFYIRHSTLAKCCVPTGELLAYVDLFEDLPGVRRAASITHWSGPGRDELFRPMAINADASKIIVRTNFSDPMANGCGLVAIETKTLRVVGYIGESLGGASITHVEFFKQQLYVSAMSPLASPLIPSSSTLYFFRRHTSRTPFGATPIPARVGHVPGCFRVFEENSVYIACVSEADGAVEPGMDAAAAKIVGINVTDSGILVVLFALETGAGHASLVVHGIDGIVRGKAVSHSGVPCCLALARDNATAFVGYRNGLVEAYSLPYVTLGYRFRAHRGAVNTIEETSPWLVYTAGEDAYLRQFDLRLSPLAMDFTGKLSGPVESLISPTGEEMFLRRATYVESFNVSRSSDSVESRFVICYRSEPPVVAFHERDFHVEVLKLPRWADEVRQAWLVEGSDYVIGIGHMTRSSSSPGRTHCLMRWIPRPSEDNQSSRIGLRTMEVLDTGVTVYCDLCAVTTNEKYLVLVRRRKYGCCVVAMDALTSEYVRKFRSHADANDDSDGVMMTDDAQFVVLAQPARRRVYVMRMANVIPGSGFKDMELEVYSDKDRYDDDGCLNDPPLYDEDDADTSLISPEVMSTAEPRDQDRERALFFLRFSFGGRRAVAVNGNFLVAGTTKGHLLLVDFVKFEEYEKDMRQGKWHRNDFFSVAVDIHSVPVTTVAMTPNQRYVTVGYDDGVIKVYDVIDRDIQATLRGHTERITCLAVTSGNLFVVSGSADRMIRLWNLFTGRLLTTFSAYQDVVEIQLFRREDDNLKVAAMLELDGQRRLMLFKTLNLIATNKQENF